MLLKIEVKFLAIILQISHKVKESTTVVELDRQTDVRSILLSAYALRTYLRIEQ